MSSTAVLEALSRPRGHQLPHPRSVSRPKPIVLEDWWRRYTRTDDPVARDRLTLAYAPLAKWAAGRIAARMPAHVDAADLISYGLEGLIRAIERFDPTRGISFESYAKQRIQGAIFDAVRALDWVPRAVRDEAHEIARATTALTTRLQRSPSEQELATELSTGLPQLRAGLQRIADAEVVSLDRPWGLRSGDEEPLGLIHVLPDPGVTDDPAASAEALSVRASIAKAVRCLRPREQTVLALHYHRELNFAEIGEVLGLSGSRISQLHTHALLQLGGLLSAERTAGAI